MNEDLNRVIQVDLEKEMKESYLAYSMSVIVSRAFLLRDAPLRSLASFRALPCGPSRKPVCSRSVMERFARTGYVLFIRGIFPKPGDESRV